MTVVLYWMSISHPSQVARKMLDLKGIEYELVDVIPLNQRRATEADVRTDLAALPALLDQVDRSHRSSTLSGSSRCEWRLGRSALILDLKVAMEEASDA
jgi:hypothetical protein